MATTIKGDLSIVAGIDPARQGAGSLTVAKNITVGGNLIVKGDRVNITEQNIHLLDGFIYLNEGDVLPTEAHGGIVWTLKSDLESDVIDIDDSSINVKNSTGFEPGNLIKLPGCGDNTGIYEIREIVNSKIFIRNSTLE